MIGSKYVPMVFQCSLVLSESILWMCEWEYFSSHNFHPNLNFFLLVKVDGIANRKWIFFLLMAKMRLEILEWHFTSLNQDVSSLLPQHHLTLVSALVLPSKNLCMKLMFFSSLLLFSEGKSKEHSICCCEDWKWKKEFAKMAKKVDFWLSARNHTINFFKI